MSYQTSRMVQLLRACLGFLNLLPGVLTIILLHSGSQVSAPVLWGLSLWILIATAWTSVTLLVGEYRP